jgi:hypothetical protein
VLALLLGGVTASAAPARTASSGLFNRLISALVDRFKALNPGRVDVAGNGAEDGRGVGGSFLA